jgi:hypothetical protein
MNLVLCFLVSLDQKFYVNKIGNYHPSAEKQKQSGRTPREQRSFQDRKQNDDDRGENPCDQSR